MIKLFECVPLAAKISKDQCDRNRKRTDNHANGSMAIAACKGCSGLGGAMQINTEGIIMPEVKRKMCDEIGCKNIRWKGGKCWSHHPDHVAKREAKAVVETVVAAPAAVAAPVVVSQHEIHVVNLVELFKAKQQAELEHFISALSSLSADPLKKLEYAFGRVC